MSVHVDGGALWRDLMTMGAIGATARGGSYRTALSDADRDARNLFVLWAKEANLSVTIVGSATSLLGGKAPIRRCLQLWLVAILTRRRPVADLMASLAYLLD